MKTRPKTIFLVLFFAFSTAGRAQQPIFVEPLAQLKISDAPIYTLVPDFGGSLVAVYSTDGSVKVFDGNQATERAAFMLDPALTTCIEFFGEGRLLIGQKNGSIRWFDLHSGTSSEEIEACEASVAGIHPLPDSTVLVCDAEGIGEIIDMRDGDDLRTVDFVKQKINKAVFEKNSGTVALSARDEKIYLYDAGYSEVKVLTDLGGPSRLLTFSPGGQHLVTASSGEAISVWDTESWERKAIVDSLGGAVVSMSIDPQERWLAAITSDSVLHVLSFPNLTPLNRFSAEGEVFTEVSFALEGQLWIGRTDGVALRWQLSTRAPDTTAPVLVFENPALTNDSIAVKVYATDYTVEGVAYENRGLSSVVVGGVRATISADAFEDSTGRTGKKFSARVPLTVEGLNAVVITASDEQGNTVDQVVRIYRISRDEAVEIIQPAANEQTERVVIPLEFKTWFPIRSYSVSVNLSEIFQGKGRSQESGESVREEVPLVMGYNQIQLKIRGVKGEEVTRTFGVTRKVSGLDGGQVATTRKPSKKRGPGPQAWAVVIGVSDYADPAIPSLKYADRDAEAFASFLQTPEGGGYDSDHLRVLLNKEATLSNLKDALMNFLQYAIDTDLVIIFFAGHGAPEPARPDNLYLLTHDSNPASLATTAFPMWDVQTAISRYISAKRVVVFSDACHSGGISVGYTTRGMDVTESNLINQYFTDLARTKEGVVVFTASAAGEVSQEFPDLGHGVFTYYLLEGVRGEADLNNDYTVTINEVMQYVEENVKRKTRGAQNPTRSQTTYDKDLTISLIPHD